MDMVTLTIDGRPITVEKGKTILQAALEHGISIPYYCYHPALGVDGSCRVCVVKVEKMPKLQTSCSTVCAEGMVVETRSPEVIEARASVLEFLLLNHPLDCPVCDKGGECPLQDFAYTFGPNQSRTDFTRRTFDGEGVKADVDFGPTLMLNRNRCIMCTRCVRFMREVDGDAQIAIVNRGYGSEISTFQEEGVHSLLSGNLMDVCPVGAITTRDYRFKARPWDNPLAVDTICTQCSKGCNITAWIKAKPEWAKGARLVRMTPRLNAEVNGYWMCDIGRFEYHWIEGDDRLRMPLLRTETGTQEPAGWREAVERVREGVSAQGVGPALRFLVSAHASNEELFLAGRVAEGLTGVRAAEAVALTWRYREKPQPARTRFVVPPVDAPNVNGARDLGFQVPAGDIQGPDLSALRAAVDAGQVRALYVIDPGPDGSLGDVEWIVAARRSGKLDLLIFQGVLPTDLARVSDVVLPGAAYVEKDATYTNDAGHVQATSTAIAPPGEAKADWQILVAIGAAFGLPVTYADAAHVRLDLASAMARDARYKGIPQLPFARPVPAKHWLQTSNPSERWKWDVLFQDLPPVKFAENP
jgi:NADH-quinone oxidoreductase subunit G